MITIQNILYNLVGTILGGVVGFLLALTIQIFTDSDLVLFFVIWMFTQYGAALGGFIFQKQE